MQSLSVLEPPIKAKFPYCQLHGHNIVNALPVQCPFRTQLLYKTIGAMQDAAWQSAMRGDDDAGEVMDIYETCWACIGKINGHRTIQRLRRELGVIE